MTRPVFLKWVLADSNVLCHTSSKTCYFLKEDLHWETTRGLLKLHCNHIFKFTCRMFQVVCAPQCASHEKFFWFITEGAIWISFSERTGLCRTNCFINTNRSHYFCVLNPKLLYFGEEGGERESVGEYWSASTYYWKERKLLLVL